MESRTAKISETFLSCQFEGPFSGWPAFFIRFSGCCEPLCDFCDSKFAWDGGTEVAVDELVKRAAQATKLLARRLVVVTGGEPAQYPEVLADLCSRLSAVGLQVQIETSGKVAFPPYLLHVVTYVCSPKWSDAHKRFMIHPDALSSHYFKFVVGNEVDVARVLKFVTENHLHKEDCYLMPLGATRAEQQELMPRVVEWCKATGFLFSARLHILIWDKKRGV